MSLDCGRTAEAGTADGDRLFARRPPPDSAPDARRHSIAIIGAGPRSVGVLERLAANAAEFRRPGEHITVHLIDPFPPGAGRIWRYEQSPLLKLNSMAADVTMFTDASSTMEGPVRPGPSLIEWAERVREGEIEIVIDDPALRSELKHLTGGSFATRRLQSLYLDWFYQEALRALPENYRVYSHTERALRVDDLDSGTQRVVLDSGVELDVDVVLYSLGHNGSTPEREHSALIDFAARHELFYLPPAFTTDADTRALAPHQRVIVRGLGLAAVDLTVLLTEGRGGRYERSAEGDLRYLPSGREPVLLLGSRRGVPYHSKISSKIVGDALTPTFFTPEIVARLEAEHESLDFVADVWPLIAKEMLWAYYRELFTGHPERTSISWQQFSAEFTELEPQAVLAADARLRALVERSVIDPIDRLLLPEFDRPLAGRTFGSEGELQAALRDYITADLTLRTVQQHSATLGLFMGLLTSLFTLSPFFDSPVWSAESRVRDLNGWWLGYFSYIASGPPGHRLEELLALSEAGVVEFLGGELSVETDDDRGQFVARSPNLDREVRASALVDARLPQSNVARSENDLLRSLIESGAGLEEVARDAGFSEATGRLSVRRGDTRVQSASGEHHDRRYAVGPYTSSPVVGAFSRPRTNAIAFRENDRVARAILAQLGELG
ncbi:FAD/NAD(P)-binding protein [Subtercola lobariae]|uniref:Adenylate cyclase n=1 Tax=Subtercola lobariae TaxID=1588641 RepID=A0A917B500_9MICO|nr:FAD/NAD(P)-binding protein [Subtercola lobariae]GGF22184.1 adenylate cyclase [Subtercola lobariae]